VEKATLGQLWRCTMHEVFWTGLPSQPTGVRKVTRAGVLGVSASSLKGSKTVIPLYFRSVAVFADTAQGSSWAYFPMPIASLLVSCSEGRNALDFISRDLCRRIPAK
jgi:hypothetical protein